MKYVMLDKRFPILFPDHMSHVSFEALESKKITSAASFSVDPDGVVKTFGGSTSISPPVGIAREDAIIIEMLLKGTLDFMNTFLQVAQMAHGVRTLKTLGLDRDRDRNGLRPAGRFTMEEYLENLPE